MNVVETQRRRDFHDRRKSIHGGSAKTSVFSTVIEVSSPSSLLVKLVS